MQSFIKHSNLYAMLVCLDRETMFLFLYLHKEFFPYLTNLAKPP